MKLFPKKKKYRPGEPQIYGIPPNEKISHAGRIYGLTFIMAAVALVQWIIIYFTIGKMNIKVHQALYGWWLLCTFYAIAVLAWTKFGRKVPFNYILLVVIVETSTAYIAMEQTKSENGLVDFYAGVIVVALVVASVFWGAYFPMFVVPGDLMLSLLVAISNIMLILFFINSFWINYEGIYVAVRNCFAVISISIVMYTATIIHGRQFDVPKNEYLFLSALQFFAYMVLNERILTLASTTATMAKANHIRSKKH